jgi:hypothetical protein
MARLDYADVAGASDGRREQFARLPINLTRMLLHSPQIAKGGDSARYLFPGPSA